MKIISVLSLVLPPLIMWEACGMYARVKPAGSPWRKCRMALVWMYYLYAMAGAFCAFFKDELAVGFLLVAITCEMSARRIADRFGTFVYAKRKGEE